MDLRKQFAKPAGPVGWLVGHVMAMKNRERSEFVFAVLDLKPEDRVLEIGFGPGADIARASQAAAFVAGIDHSDVMVKQATRRNASAIRAGRVRIELGSAIALAVQPRQKGATEDHAHAAGRRLADAMKKAGFLDIYSEARPMKPVSTVCVLGKK